MKDCMNVAGGVFGVMVPVALLVCGWNVPAPAKWCWVESGKDRRNEVAMTRKKEVVIPAPENQPSIAPVEGLNPWKVNERLVGNLG